MGHRPQKLSVTRAMKDIADYKITKAKADMAPTLVERAKLELDWDKQDRPYDLKIKKQSIKKGEQDIAKTARETRTNFLGDIVSFYKWISEGEIPEEKEKRYAIARREITEKYEDEVTSASPDAVAGDLIPPEYDEAQISRIADLAGEELIKLGKNDRLVSKRTGEEKVGALEDNPKTAMAAFLKNNPDASNEEIANFARLLQKPSSALTLEERKELEKYKAGLKKDRPGTGAERDRATLIAKLPQFQAEAKTNPNKLYDEKGIRLDENAQPTVDAFGAPVVLPTFESVAGKRGAPKALMTMGEQWDDAKELQALLRKPKVADDLKREIDSGLLQRIKGKTLNELNKWMAEKGIASDSDTATAIRRMQRLASEERKEFMGVAVTELEVKSSLAWMPDAGDSYDAMINKINIMAQEGEQHFKRYMDVYKNKVNMAPYYNAWGLQRFYEHPNGNWSEKEPIYKDANGNAARYLGDGKWERL